MKPSPAGEVTRRPELRQKFLYRVKSLFRYISRSLVFASLATISALSLEILNATRWIFNQERNLKRLNEFVPYIIFIALGLLVVLVLVQVVVRRIRIRRMSGEMAAFKSLQLVVQNAYRLAMEKSVINPCRREV